MQTYSTKTFASIVQRQNNRFPGALAAWIACEGYQSNQGPGFNLVPTCSQTIPTCKESNAKRPLYGQGAFGEKSALSRLAMLLNNVERVRLELRSSDQEKLRTIRGG